MFLHFVKTTVFPYPNSVARCLREAFIALRLSYNCLFVPVQKLSNERNQWHPPRPMVNINQRDFDVRAFLYLRNARVDQHCLRVV
jgi:hypothetical protein